MPELEKKTKNSETLIILCHGFFGNKNQFFIKELSDFFREEYNFHTFRFDFSGNGESQGKFSEAGIIKEKGIIKIQDIPIALILL